LTTQYRDLWLNFASCEASWHQYKQAQLLYERALVSNPEMASRPHVWRAYAAFSISRGRLANAKHIYCKAVASVAVRLIAQAEFERY